MNRSVVYKDIGPESRLRRGYERVGIVSSKIRDANRWRELIRPFVGKEEAIQRWTAATSALRDLIRSPTELLLTELTLPDWDGLDLISVVQRRNLARQIVVLLDRRREQDLLDAPNQSSRLHHRLLGVYR